jgi:hypothetical protein
MGTEYQAEYRQSRPSIPPLPSSPAYLTLAGHTITSKYKTKIREAATVPNLKAYVGNRFHWTHNTITDDIDWDVYKKLVSKQRQSHKIMVKHLHAIAPTGHLAHRHQPHQPQGCPACNCPDETNDHLIICPAYSRKQWRLNTTTQLFTKIGKSWPTDPVLEAILEEGLLRVHNNLAQPVQCESYEPNYHQLIRSQTKIGWIQLYRGKWSQAWSAMHTAYAKQARWQPSLQDGKAWVQKCGHHLLERWKILWSLRNEERHGKDDNDKQAKMKTSLLHQLEHYYRLSPSVVPVDRNLLFPHQHAARHLEQSSNLDQLQEWILDNLPRAEASADQAKLHLSEYVCEKDTFSQRSHIFLRSTWQDNQLKEKQSLD